MRRGGESHQGQFRPSSRCYSAASLVASCSNWLFRSSPASLSCRARPRRSLDRSPRCVWHSAAARSSSSLTQSATPGEACRLPLIWAVNPLKIENLNAPINNTSHVQELVALVFPSWFALFFSLCRHARPSATSSSSRGSAAVS